MNTATMKLWLRRMLWMSPFISYLIYCILIYIVEVNRHTVFYENYGQVVEENIPEKIQMPAISICSSNQYSYRDVDNILKMKMKSTLTTPSLRAFSGTLRTTKWILMRLIHSLKIRRVF